MKTTNFLPMTKSIKWVTTLAIIMIFIGVLFMILSKMIVGVTVVSLVTVSAICMIPRKAVACKEGVDIHLLAWKVRVPSEDIEKIEHYPHGIEAGRIVGAGMFFGNIGLFSCRECGKHFSLVTNPMDVCVIIRKTKMPIVVSVEDYTIFNVISQVQEKY
jgi:hypothetical protein